MKRKKLKGFTLVELLIVIALIAILSVAVLATLNPIEQINKARDSRVQNDASEVLSAYERYFAAKSEYPWVSYKPTGGAGAILASSAVVLRSETFGFGVCSGSTSATGIEENPSSAATSCNPSDSAQNVLIKTGELKTSMIGRDEFEPVRDTTKPEQALWAVKAASADTVYVCYVPKSTANRNNTAGLRCISTAGVITGVAGGCAAPTAAQWAAADPAAYIVANPTVAAFVCLPN